MMPDEFALECLLEFVPKAYEDRMLELNVTNTAQAFDYIHWKLSQLNLDRLADIEERDIQEYGSKGQSRLCLCHW